VIHAETFTNGLTLVAEEMPWLESVAFTCLVPSGCAFDPPGQAGLANLLCDMVERGCGERDSREFVETLDALGVDHNAAPSTLDTTFSASMVADKLPATLGIYADLLRQARLPADQLEDSRQVCLQELMALGDDLPQRAMLALRATHYPAPLGANVYGTFETVQAITDEDVRRAYASAFRPGDTILSVAGKLDWSALRDLVCELLGDWPSAETPPLPLVDPSGGYHHIEHDSNQTQVTLAYPTVVYRDERFYPSRAAVGILSDGMSSRLFSEVRENRGLCYSISASYHSHPDHAAVLCYAGTSADRAQETLDVTVSELLRLPEGVEEDELNRMKARTKSAIIMQQESSRSRSVSLAFDWRHLGRARTMQEVKDHIDALRVDRVNAFLRENPPADFTCVTLGPKPLEMPDAISS